MGTLARFALVGLAAVLLGWQILQVPKSQTFLWAIYGFIGLCVIGSAISVIEWIKRSRKRAGGDGDQRQGR